MNDRRGRGWVWAGLAMSLSLAGCPQPQTQPPAPRPGQLEVTNSDACSELLHELCEKLLRYYITHRDLPETLAELGTVGGKPASSLTCPISGQPYVYNFDGLEVPGWPGRLIVYDGAASHEGRRWAILAEPPRPGKPIVLRVVRPPESAFAPAFPSRRAPAGQPR